MNIKKEIASLFWMINEWSDDKDQLWFNTEQPNIELLKLFVKKYPFRVFIRKGNDTNGYPLWCIYWGKKKNPIPTFNTFDNKKIYELK